MFSMATGVTNDINKGTFQSEKYSRAKWQTDMINAVRNTWVWQVKMSAEWSVHFVPVTSAQPTLLGCNLPQRLIVHVVIQGHSDFAVKRQPINLLQKLRHCTFSLKEGFWYHPLYWYQLDVWSHRCIIESYPEGITNSLTETYWQSERCLFWFIAIHSISIQMEEQKVKSWMM